MPISRYTPGPWHHKDDLVIWSKDGARLAEIDELPGAGTTEAEQEANARLIAAAPATLAELSWLANELHKAANGGDRTASNMRHLRDHARTAIANAEA